MITLSSLTDACRLVEQHSITVASIGDTPFFVSGLEEILPVRFISLLRAGEADFPGFETFFAGDMPDGRPHGDRLTIDQILAHPTAQKWLRTPEVSGVCVWDYSEESEEVCQSAGITLLATPRKIVRTIEDKVALASVVRELGLPTLPHIVLEAGQSSVSWREVCSLLGDDVVVQCSANNSNGKLTYRVRTAAEFDDIIARHPEESLKCTTCVSGGSFNLNAVILPHQFVPGIGFRQLVGVPELIGVPFGYCGNDAPLSRWFRSETIEAAWRDLERLGDWIRASGYRGLLGVDFVVDDSGVPYIVDVNPRMQSSQGLVTAVQLAAGLPPIALLHVLHHLGHELTVDVDRYWKVARASNIELSQTVIFHTGEPDFGSGVLRPGTIDLATGSLQSLGTSLRALRHRDVGILHRTCEEGRYLAPNATMLAIQAWRTALSDRNTLLPWVADLVASLRRQAVLSGFEPLNQCLTPPQASDGVVIA